MKKLIIVIGVILSIGLWIIPVYRYVTPKETGHYVRTDNSITGVDIFYYEEYDKSECQELTYYSIYANTPTDDEVKNMFVLGMFPNEEDPYCPIVSNFYVKLSEIPYTNLSNSYYYDAEYIPLRLYTDHHYFSDTELNAAVAGFDVIIADFDALEISQEELLVLESNKHIDKVYGALLEYGYKTLPTYTDITWVELTPYLDEDELEYFDLDYKRGVAATTQKNQIVQLHVQPLLYKGCSFPLELNYYEGTTCRMDVYK